MERFSFTVLGQVTVPQISILEPRLGDDLNLTLSMNPTLVGRRAMKSLKFQNTSKVRAQVRSNEVRSKVSRVTILLLIYPSVCCAISLKRSNLVRFSATKIDANVLKSKERKFPNEILLFLSSYFMVSPQSDDVNLDTNIAWLSIS
jgi:hypothetical protein